jgi:ribosome-binding protein aMBF1 (putative translation factor)
MSIYQDWTPVDIGNKKLKSKSHLSSQNIKKVEEYDGIPPTVLYWTTELIIALQQLRNTKGISQKDLAKKLNLPSTTISDIEGNKCAYNQVLYKKIYRFLGGDPSTLNFPKAK